MLKAILIFLLLLSIFEILQVSETATVTRESRIINGTAAQLNSVKHLVSIRHRKEEDEHFGTGHMCGGSLISRNVVLTAAHCFVRGYSGYYPDRDFVVVMGNLDRFANNSNTLRFDILRSIKGSFNLDLDEDIALIILNGTVPANHPTIQTITLNDGPIRNNTLCQAAGWGSTEEFAINLSSPLMTVDVPIIDVDDCRNKTEYGSRIRVGMLCAGYLEGGRDTCTADSGGPLVCRGVQAGIVSWGEGCGQPLKPGVYTDVALYKDWILAHLTSNMAFLPEFAPVPDGTTELNLCSLLLSFVLIVYFVC